MTTVLGVDGGGTKTHALVADEIGNVLGSGISGPANWEETGLGGAAAAMGSAIREAASAAGRRPADVEQSVFGLAGIDWESDLRRLDVVADSLKLGGPSRILNDSFVALRAGTTEPWGMVIVAGTGSVTAGRNRDGELFRTLGEGPRSGTTAARRTSRTRESARWLPPTWGEDPRPSSRTCSACSSVPRR